MRIFCTIVGAQSLTDSPLTVSSAGYYVIDIAVEFVFLLSLFCRELAGFLGLAFKTICGREGFTRDLGRGRYENLPTPFRCLLFSQAEQPTSRANPK